MVEKLTRCEVRTPEAPAMIGIPRKPLAKAPQCSDLPEGVQLALEQRDRRLKLQGRSILAAILGERESRGGAAARRRWW